MHAGGRRLRRRRPRRPTPRARADPNKDRLIIFDTTLRDGEQSPGATLNLTEKLQIARQLSRLGVDVCEAGFPIASPGDFEAVKTIARAIGPMTDNRPSGEPMSICGLSRATEKDIDRCFNAVKYAPRHRIHTFRFHQANFDHFIGSRGHILTHEIGPNRQFSMAPVQ